MRPFVIVCPKPLCREQLGMLDAVKTMHIQPFMSDRSFEALDVGILGRLAGLDLQQRDLLLICPADQSLADVFRPVIATQSQRFPAPLDNLL